MYAGCNKTYYVQSKLLVHLRMHFGIKPFVCHFCAKSFNEKGNLKTHLRIHTNERPYNCKQCNKSFKTEGQLKEHIFSHYPDKPFQCPYCLHFFKRKGVLKTHMVIHRKDPEYLAKIDFYENVLKKINHKDNSDNNTINSTFSNENSKGTTEFSPVLNKDKEVENVENFGILGKNKNEKIIEKKNDFNFNFGNNLFNFFGKFNTNDNYNFMKDYNCSDDEIEDVNSIEYIDPLNQGNWYNNEVLFGDN